MLDALLADETAAVYALIDRRLVGQFAPLGVQTGRSQRAPAESRTYLIGRAVTTLGSLLRRQPIRIVPCPAALANGLLTNEGQVRGFDRRRSIEVDIRRGE
jgi:hypothetical protein